MHGKRLTGSNDRRRYVQISSLLRPLVSSHRSVARNIEALSKEKKKMFQMIKNSNKLRENCRKLKQNCDVYLPDNMAVMESISFEQLWLQLAISILASCGSNGNSAMTAPKSVKLPSSSSAAK